ncbi:MFS transporter [Gulosibacter molinativorax]|uniref:MFS transporter n=1 Tax=Gulosibacter molinativorax TaxID=256821 RepID=A0ABT7C518_9MICO|nr:MFS transporter [Gulosibacter molinativorax]MDJ1369781.1 MFS transporter [Gulosibacter molinativorax]QUY61746.1 Major facilitator transporter [Gulosibacter molinativorax]
MGSAIWSALAGYKILPKIAGWPQMLLALFARIPAAMVPLGTMAAISASTGSIATGGLATGFVSLATAIFSPLIGQWVDRFGQRPVLSIIAPINAVALVGLFLAALTALGGPALFALCALVGATMIPIGSFTRARWSMIAEHPRDLSTAFSYESTVDELVFVLGPAFVGIAAAAAAPAAPLGVASAVVLLAVIPFALTSPKRVPAQVSVDGTAVGQDARPSILTTLTKVAPALIIMASIGTFFGTSQAAITQRATEFGNPDAAGLVYALMGVGSAAMALLAVAIPESVGLPVRVVIGGAGMAVFTFLTLVQDNLALTGVMLLVSGLFLGPTLVTAFSAAEKLAPRGGMSVAMTSLQAAMTVGVSIGSSIGGALAQSYGDPAAYWFATAIPLVVVLVGIALTRNRRATSA